MSGGGAVLWELSDIVIPRRVDRGALTVLGTEASLGRWLSRCVGEERAQKMLPTTHPEAGRNWIWEVRLEPGKEQ